MALVGSTALGEVTRAIDLAGVFASAILGGAVAARERLDVIGFVTLAVISGVGGGLIRDTLLQHGTPVALTDYAYLLTALAGAGVAFLLRIEGRGWNVALLGADALALGFWAAAGAQKTLQVGLGWLPAVLLGTITAVGGGATRDVMMRQVPAIFGGTIYATAALAASGIVVACTKLGVPTVGLVAGIVLGAGLRLLSVRYNWTLPKGRNWSLQTGREWWARVPNRPVAPTVKSWRASRLTRRGGTKK
ncbi:trimeric intracellular cation channel family protein [Actinocatenispora rupis]|uniref:Glycine transporter domain-containing protein n=1 Tax=Actinocatenispora rupis TaxID=519421 RepID=A0A8J3JD42_9ACTN|nr:trimeric intracellular cation channel family protein [Actinocatenispora rupis]GID14529.1 hypothetical protein Aru02nite_54180 [Actinocatenispora rupis]